MILILKDLVSELTIEGSRLAPVVQIPCMPELLVAQDTTPGSIEIEFKVIPVFFNIGINERQTIQDTMKRKQQSYISLIGKPYSISMLIIFDVLIS